MKKTKEKFYVKYVEENSGKLKEFETEAEMNKFVAEFAVMKASFNPDDNWVEFTFKGEVLLEGSI